MGKAIVFLMALAVALAVVVAVADATPPGLRRSRFLAAVKIPLPPLVWSNCKKKPDVCKEKGSPGKDCCLDFCVDTKKSPSHCGECGNNCRYGLLCCDGKCVDVLNDKNNCGLCDVKCRKKCQFGQCDYAA